MAFDPFKRFSRKQKDKRLADISRASMTPEEIEAEEEMIRNAPKAEPLKAEKEPGRNDPCPCGSGKKYKRCCALKKKRKK